MNEQACPKPFKHLLLCPKAFPYEGTPKQQQLGKSLGVSANSDANNWAGAPAVHVVLRWPTAKRSAQSVRS